MIRIMVVEDQTLVREAISALLQLETDIDVVAQAANGRLALDMLKDIDIDLLLTDIEMPELSGIELIEQAKPLYPQMKTMVMTTFSRSGYIRRALNAGVGGFILKEAPSDELVHAINSVMLGRKVIDPELAVSALGDLDPLSNKERKALKLAGEGLKTADIAKRLCLSEGTVRNYLSEAISKLNAGNRVDAARIAQQKGWL